jgi:hypothetical protein
MPPLVGRFDLRQRLRRPRLRDAAGATTASPCLRPSRADEKTRYGEPMLKKVRQLIESVNDTLNGQLDLEDHGGRSRGVAIRVAQRILAMAAAIWHNHHTHQPVIRSLITYDH